ncbi:MAG: M15 family metallopeptidase [Rhodobacterales bacterium]|nr:M15 family metallopeptidase [Rhodobacterales bacterium]
MLRLALLLVLWTAPLKAACTPRDFLTIPLPAGGDPVATALEIAYPGSTVNGAAIVTPDGAAIPFAPARDISAQDRLDGATIGDMFVYAYPIAFDLDARMQPYFDPGRVRNEVFFRALYADRESAARATLVAVAYDGQTVQTGFNVTTRNCVDTQLAAALTALALSSPLYDVFFDQSGGSFNWRVIAGTDRQSSHSFGAAIDLNTELGGYWRWSGRPEGDAGPYDNKMPTELVAAFERYGFIWGGKWHHYDGMHFEYRPELILYARLTRQ